MNSSARIKGIFCITGAALSWGAAVPLAKGGLAQSVPGVLLLIQLATSCAVLFAILTVRGVSPVRACRAVRFAWLGLLEPGITYLVDYVGLACTDAGIASIIFASEAILVVVLSMIFLHEKASARFLACAGLMCAGLVMALWTNASQPSSRFGISMGFLGALLAAGYVVLSRRAAQADDPVLIIAAQQLVGLLFVAGYLCLSSWDDSLRILSSLAPRTWLWSCVSGIAAFALPFCLYLAGMRRVSVNLAGVSLSLTPVVGILIANAVLDERLAVHQLVGAGLVVGALMLIHAHALCAEGTRAGATEVPA